VCAYAVFGSQWDISAIQQANLNRRYVNNDILCQYRHIEPGTSLPVGRADSVVVPRDFLHECAAHALENATLSLISESIRIRNLTAVQRRDEFARLNASTCQVNSDIGNQVCEVCWRNARGIQPCGSGSSLLRYRAAHVIYFHRSGAKRSTV
jgi:hypothetical protein